MNAEKKGRRLQELKLALGREDFQTVQLEDDILKVRDSGQDFCYINAHGAVSMDLNYDAFVGHGNVDKVDRIARTVAEYMSLMERAPTLNARGLSDEYKLLAEFNGIVFAGQDTERYGMQFVTWSRDYDGQGVTIGHYFGYGYEQAKADFALRSGLIEQDRLFSEQQLTELYRCCEDAKEWREDLSYEQEKFINGIQEQISELVPDLEARLQVQTEQGQTMG